MAVPFFIALAGRYILMLSFRATFVVKFLLVGTQVGNIHILDHQGNRTKTLTTHTTPVSHISIDEKGLYLNSDSVILYTVFLNSIHTPRFTRLTSNAATEQ